MKKNFGSRLLSMVLTLAMVAGMVNFVSVDSSAALDTTVYATPATDAELDSVPKWFTGDDGAHSSGSYAKVIDGVVYVWGKNTYNLLGLGSAVASGDNVTSPTKIPVESFGGAKNKVVRIFFVYSTALAMTEEDETGKQRLWTWGYYLPGDLGVASTGIGTPTEYTKTTALGSNKISEIVTSGRALFVKDTAGTWYSAGANSQATCLQLNTSTCQSLTKLPDTLYTITGGKKITHIAIGGCYQNAFITEDGKLWSWGYQDTSCHTVGFLSSGGATFVVPFCLSTADGTTVAYKTLADYNGKTNGVAVAKSALNGLKFTSVVAEDQGVAAIDQNGDVWAWGASNYNRFLQNPGNVYLPVKVYDHTGMNGANRKAVRIFLGYRNVFVLSEDNTVFATGYNPNGMIDHTLTTDGINFTNVSKMTQVFKSISENETIVGVIVSSNSAMCVTKSGSMYFAGDNSTGGAGNGTTTSETPGTVATVEPATLPPAEPLTSNKISFEIEYTDRQFNQEHKYTCVNNVIYDSVTNTTLTEFPDIETGSAFKLNVYFEDFGKITSWTVPIRFNPNYVQVTNAAGTAYSSGGSVVTPTSAANSGITQCFNSTQWSGGSITFGTTSGTYPKINNGEGWLSVQGYSTDTSASISGKVKMFSVTFMSVTELTGKEASFLIADKTNTQKFVTSASSSFIGYDDAIDCNNGGAFWGIRNSVAAEDKTILVSEFAFKNGGWEVPYKTYTEMLTKVGLEISLNGTNLGDYRNEDPSWENTHTAYNGMKVRAINWKNKTNSYVVTATPTPTWASFPNVTWTVEKCEGDTDKDVTDYITIVNQSTSAITFKIAEEAVFEDGKNKEGLLKFTATSEKYPDANISDTILVWLKSYSAPEALKIVPDPSATIDGDGAVVYHSATITAANSFGVEFTPANAQNKAVVWTMWDMEGNQIMASDSDAKAIINGTDSGTYSATVKAQHSHSGDAYYTLRVASVFDGGVYGEIKIKVQLYATELKFSSSTARMVINSTKDLTSLLGYAPAGDVYATNLEWSIKSSPTDRPNNAQASDTGPFIYATMASGASAGTVISGQWSTPGSKTGVNEKFVVVQVKDTLSGLATTINVAILDLNSPIGLDDIQVTNALNTNNDVVSLLNIATLLSSGKLKENDIIRIYKSYDDETTYLDFTLTGGYLTSPIFKVGDKSTSYLASSGGEIAVQVIRTEGGVTTNNDKIPVSYSSEPSAVQGYIRLLGRESSSAANKGIKVVISGVNHTQEVETTSGGYFKFTEYIAPGTYKLTISKPNYITREIAPDAASGYAGLVIVAAEEFNISTQANPIYLYPGELNGDGTISIQDVNLYTANWVGLTSSSGISGISDYDFYENGAAKINSTDLELILSRKDWSTVDYPHWNVPKQ